MGRAARLSHRGVWHRPARIRASNARFPCFPGARRVISLRDSGKRCGGLTSSAVGFLAMQHAANFNGIHGGAHKENPVIAYAQPKFFSPLKLFYVTFARL